jgi:hypothetical protein
MDTQAMAEEIRQQGSHEFADPQDVHDTLVGMHEIVAAVQETLQQWSEQLSETGVHPAYVDATESAAASMSGIAEELQQVTAGGVMHGPGG